MISRSVGKPGGKIKKSYTLSPSSLTFLDAMRERRQAESISAILEEILQDVRRQQELASVERAVTNYYSSLTDEEVAANAQWGEFAMTQFEDRDES